MLDTLPTEVNAIFTEAMTQITAQNHSTKDLAETYVQRSLSLKELQYTLAT